MAQSVRSFVCDGIAEDPIGLVNDSRFEEHFVAVRRAADETNRFVARRIGNLAEFFPREVEDEDCDDCISRM